MTLPGEGYEVVGVALAGPAPIAATWIEIEGGVTALYGKNGAGKTLLLKAIGQSLVGVDPDHGLVRDLCIRVLSPHDKVENHLYLGMAFERIMRSIAATVGEVNAVTAWQDDDFYSMSDVAHDGSSYRDVIAAILSADGSHVDSQIVDAIASDGLLIQSGYSQMIGPAFAGETVELYGDLTARYFGSTCDEDLGDLVVYALRMERAVGYFPLTRTAISRRTLELVDLSSVISWARYQSHIQVMVETDLQSRDHVGPWYFVADRGSAPLPSPIRATLNIAAIEVIDLDIPLPGGLVLATIETLSPTEYRSLAQQARMAAASVIVHLAENRDVVLHDRAAETLERIESLANEFFSSLIGTDLQLRFELGSPDEWLLGHRPAWLAKIGPSLVPIDNLSAAEQRWAEAAIRLALAAARERRRPIAVLVDEPERGLHRQAEAQILRGLKQISVKLGGAAIIVATHSPVILGDLGVTRIHVSRDDRRMVKCESLSGAPESTEQQSQWLNEMGLLPEDITSLTRVWIAVEGPHDREVLKTALADTLDRYQGQIVPMSGALNVVGTLEWLARFSDGNFVVVIDNHERFQDHLSQLLDSTLEPRVRKQLLGELRAGGELEAEAIGHLIEWAHKRGQVSRISIPTMRRGDIIEYLDSSFLGLTQDWDEIRREYRASSHRVSFKDWLLANKGARISLETIRRASAALAEGESLPEDLETVRRAIVDAAFKSSNA